ncbi:hypothetical protein [Olsenella sp. AGMB03486]|uniref:hypothetical protein n=1 Tax=Olsenella sp. AGMB03486 TaxID=3230364 RepID=UPI0034A02024
MDEGEPCSRLFPEKADGTECVYHDPDWGAVHRELRKTGVTLRLLHGKYADALKAEGKPSMSHDRFQPVQILKRKVWGSRTFAERHSAWVLEVMQIDVEKPKSDSWHLCEHRSCLRYFVSMKCRGASLESTSAIGMHLSLRDDLRINPSILAKV